MNDQNPYESGSQDPSISNNNQSDVQQHQSFSYGSPFQRIRNDNVAQPNNESSSSQMSSSVNDTFENQQAAQDLSSTFRQNGNNENISQYNQSDNVNQPPGDTSNKIYSSDEWMKQNQPVTQNPQNNNNTSKVEDSRGYENKSSSEQYSQPGPAYNSQWGNPNFRKNLIDSGGRIMSDPENRDRINTAYQKHLSDMAERRRIDNRFNGNNPYNNYQPPYSQYSNQLPLNGYNQPSNGNYGNFQNPENSSIRSNKNGRGIKGSFIAMTAAVAIVAAIGGGVAGGIVGHNIGENDSSSISITKDSNSGNNTSFNNAPISQGSSEKAASIIAPSVVTITVNLINQYGQTSGDMGSGVVLDKNGNILTNNHVIAAAVEAAANNKKSQNNQNQTQQQPQIFINGIPMTPNTINENVKATITVTLSDGSHYDASIVGTDPVNDLAVIRIKNAKDLKPATFADSSKVEVGQTVLAVGAPLGLSNTVTEGIISNLHRPVSTVSDSQLSDSNNSQVTIVDSIQTDASINPGNSGGPLVDLDGRVVGINSSIASLNTGSPLGSGESGNIGVGFSIPSNLALRISKEIIQTGKATHAQLGATVSDVTNGSNSSGSNSSSNSNNSNFTIGALIQSVVKGSSADNAGLEKGDIVTSIDGRMIPNAETLIAIIRSHAPGDEIKLTYVRDGHSKTVTVKLLEMTE